MKINFIGGAYQGRSRNINAQVCQNLFAVADQTGKEPIALMGTPGLKQFSTTAYGEVRGMLVWGSSLYAVVGATLYRIDTSGTATSAGTIGTTTGRVWLAGGTTHLCVVDGAKGYYQQAGESSLTQITDTDFPVPSSLAYQDGYFIVTESGSDAFYISASENAASWGGLDFASAEDSPDSAMVAVNRNRELWLIGETSTEAFYNSGNTAFPFTRVSGAVQPVGCGAKDSVAEGREGLFWLDDRYRVVAVNGYQVQAISTEQIEYQISLLANKSQAVGGTYSQEGHGFYVLSFPDKTFAFDTTTGLWHTRSSGMYGGRWRGQHFAFFAGKVLVGDYQNGTIWEMDLGYYKEGAALIRKQRAAAPVHSNRGLVTFASLEIEFEAGVGLATGQGSDPQAMLDWSDDGGHTWSNEHWASIGAIGNYRTRAIWRRLGSSRDRVFRLTITDPVKTVILGAHLEAAAGR